MKWDQADMRSLIFLLFVFALPCPARAQALSGRVVAISDGDTLTVLTAAKEQVKVRINGIDAPEKAQPFGQASKENLSRLVFNRVVTIESNKRDRYGRTVGKVLLDGRDAGLEQVRAGLAWHFKEYERDQAADDRRIYAGAEVVARREQRGLWRDVAPVPPWEFRHPERARTNERGSTSPPRPAEALLILGNRNSNVYHRPDCPDYARIAPQNRVPFRTARDAEAAGYRQARNCP